MPLPSKLRRRRRERHSNNDSGEASTVSPASATTEIYSEDLKQLRITVVVILTLLTLFAYLSNSTLHKAEQAERLWQQYFRSWIHSHSLKQPLALNVRTRGANTLTTVLLTPTNSTQPTQTLLALSSALHDLQKIRGKQVEFHVSLTAPGLDRPLNVLVREAPSDSAIFGWLIATEERLQSAYKEVDPDRHREFTLRRAQLAQRCAAEPLPVEMQLLSQPSDRSKSSHKAIEARRQLTYSLPVIILDVRSDRGWGRYYGDQSLPLPTITAGWALVPNRPDESGEKGCAEAHRTLVGLDDLNRRYPIFDRDFRERETDAELQDLHRRLSSGTGALVDEGIQATEGIRIPLAHASAAIAFSLLALSTLLSILLRRISIDFGACPKHILLGTTGIASQRLTLVDGPIQITLEKVFRTAVVAAAVLAAPLALASLPLIYGGLGVSSQLHVMWDFQWLESFDFASPLPYLVIVALLQASHQMLLLYSKPKRYKLGS